MKHTDKQRYNMIEQQVRPWDVHDERVLFMMAHIPRDHFIPEAYQGLAYADVAVSMGHQQVLMPPKLVARAVQALDVKSTDTVLEIGTGTGYVTCLLAHLSFHVYTIEIEGAFIAQTKERLAIHGARHVDYLIGDGSSGWAKKGPFDAIMATGAYETLPLALMQQLRIGGRLFAVVGRGKLMQAVLIVRQSEDCYQTNYLFETELPYLQNISHQSTFKF